MLVDQNIDRLKELEGCLRHAQSGKARRDLRRARRQVLRDLQNSYATVNELARGWAVVVPQRLLS